MQPHAFTAASAEEAVIKIRETLGPEAVVLNVRRLPVNGIARLWQKPMIEVVAHVPEPEPTTQESVAEISPVSEALAEFRQQLNEIKLQVENRPARVEEQSVPASDISTIPFTTEQSDLNDGKWRVGSMLRRSGLLPLPAQQVIDRLRMQFGENPPASLAEEISLAQGVLASSWRKPAPIGNKTIHVLVGPAGSGKTTCLCQWLTRASLVEGRTARVWRLDGATANTAESLSVYSEILGVPGERNWQGALTLTEDIGFVDLPGVDWRKPLALKELASQIKQLGNVHVHLVLNGAYDASILLAQARAFAALPLEDLIITHLDEETRWGKIWNLVLGTNFSVRHFTSGQNIPGDFCEASAEMVFVRQFPRK